jgi:hypothetical protein
MEKQEKSLSKPPPMKKPTHITSTNNSPTSTPQKTAKKLDKKYPSSHQAKEQNIATGDASIFHSGISAEKSPE